jgi:hypothetical protein
MFFFPLCAHPSLEKKHKGSYRTDHFTGAVKVRGAEFSAAKLEVIEADVAKEFSPPLVEQKIPRKIRKMATSVRYSVPSRDSSLRTGRSDGETGTSSSMIRVNMYRFRR